MPSSSLSSTITGNWNENTVRPFILCSKRSWPSSSVQISLLEVRPIPMEWFSTYYILSFFLNSLKGLNNNFYLSLRIPVPQSMMDVSRILFYLLNNWLGSSLFVKLKFMTIFPRKLLYLTAFWKMLKKMS